MKVIKLMCLSLLFAACIEGGIIKDDKDDSAVFEEVGTGALSGNAYRYNGCEDNEGIIVTLKQTKTIKSWQTETDETGFYSVGELPDGIYELSAEGVVDGVTKQSVKTETATLVGGTPVAYIEPLYLKIIPKVAYYKNGGTVTPPNTDPTANPAADQVDANGGVIVRQGTGLTRNGNAFKNWNTKDDGKGDSIQPGDYYTPDADTPQTRLSAQYSDEATVTYYAKDAENQNNVPQPTESVKLNTKVTLADGSGLLRTGYTFFDWNTQVDGKGKSYNSKEQITLTESLYLYAKWQGKEYTVKFDRNGGGEIDIAEKDVIFGAHYGLLPVMYFSNYNEFNGWYTEKEGGTLITSDSFVEIADDHTLYAHWERISGDGIVKVTFGGAPREQNITLTAGTTITWSTGGVLSATVNTAAGQWAQGASFAWYLDGVLISGTTAAQSIKAQEHALGTHILSVIVSKGGASYSKTVVFKIVQ